MPPAFFLKCLGLPELRRPDGGVVRFKVRKHLALLVYLAAERRQQERTRLISLLWPGVPSRQGRQSLATALSFLRSALGRGAFPGDRDWVRFVPAGLVLDLDRLGAGEVLGSEHEPPLDVDGFLTGFEVPQAPEYDLWREREHARPLPSSHAGLPPLIDHATRPGSPAATAALADR